MVSAAARRGPGGCAFPRGALSEGTAFAAACGASAAAPASVADLRKLRRSVLGFDIASSPQEVLLVQTVPLVAARVNDAGGVIWDAAISGLVIPETERSEVVRNP